MRPFLQAYMLQQSNVHFLRLPSHIILYHINENFLLSLVNGKRDAYNDTYIQSSHPV
jgi:hypothetical protein